CRNPRRRPGPDRRHQRADPAAGQDPAPDPNSSHRNTNGEQTLNEPNPRPIWPVGIDDDLPERLWPGGDFPVDEDSVNDDPTTRLVTLSFLGGALKRRTRTWGG